MPEKHGSFHRPGGADEIAGLLAAAFGDGSDGTVTISADTDLTKDMYYEDLYILAGFTLSTKGYRIFVKGRLVIAATAKIEHNGNDAVGGTGGVALAAASLGPSYAGGDGGENAVGDPGAASATEGAGEDGGDGGDAPINAGGAGGDNTLLVDHGGFHAYPRCMELHFGGTRYGGGGGGGGGGSDAVGTVGGGGGGGAGLIVIASKELELGGDIEANGGDGADAAGAGDGGGGGGGGGGVIIIVYSKLSGGGDITVTGGAGGAGVNGGAVGVAGSEGTIVKLQI